MDFLTIVVLFILSALFAPLLPLGSPDIAADLALDGIEMMVVDGAGIGRWLAQLGIWIVSALVLTLLVTHRKRSMVVNGHPVAA